MRRPGWVPYLLAFVLPVATLSFVVTMPHHWYGAVPVALLVTLLLVLDKSGAPQPALSPPQRGLPFDSILLGLALLQVANVALFVRAVRDGAAGWDGAWAILMMGATTGYSAIVVAHELVHRRTGFFRSLGRALLWVGLYDHFYIEHLRGHHVRIATGTDDAPARFDETFWRFALRSLPGELASAWRISSAQVLGGVAMEVALCVAIVRAFGSRALVAFLLQAALAGLVITAVNYFQHWGAQRKGRRMSAADAWDCDSALTHYSLLGISRHADHHLWAGRTYPELRPSAGSPKLPHGYLRMVGLVLFRNARVRELLAAELQLHTTVFIPARESPTSS